jgi:hypothetical protein
MKTLPVSAKLTITVLLIATCCSFAIAFSGFVQTELMPDAWLSLARLLGGGTIGIVMLIAITRLVQALKNQPLNGHQVTTELLIVIQKLDVAITLMNSTTRSDHERMLKHDEDFLRRIEAMTLIETQACADHNAIMNQQENITKQLDRMERLKEG